MAKNDDLRYSFSWTDRLWQNLTICCKKGEGDALDLLPKEALFTFKEMHGDLGNQPMAPRLTVCGTGILEMDPNVIHPFVRIHVCDTRTRKYLAKSNGKKD